MFSLFNFSSIFRGGSADPICPHMRTPMNRWRRRNVLPIDWSTNWVTQVEQSVGCVCVCVSWQKLPNQMTFDVDIHRASSPSSTASEVRRWGHRSKFIMVTGSKRFLNGRRDLEWVYVGRNNELQGGSSPSTYTQGPKAPIVLQYCWN